MPTRSEFDFFENRRQFAYIYKGKDGETTAETNAYEKELRVPPKGGPAIFRWDKVPHPEKAAPSES